MLSRILITLALMTSTMLQAQNSDYYLLKTYLFSDNEQGGRILKYLENAYVPSMHELGHHDVGVFSAIGNDTAMVKRIFVLVPSHELNTLIHAEDQLINYDMHMMRDMDYWATAHDNPAYDRIESSLLSAFRLHTHFAKPKLNAPKSERVYELRSYEGASEKLYHKKVEMFNEGGEIDIFRELNFNAVFYAETLVGAHTPNLMYMTTFENMADREAHWDAFRNAPAWKELSAKEEYKNTVSHIDVYLLTPADFSDF